MNKKINRKLYIVITVISFFLEILLIYLIMSSFLKNDYISPNDITFYEYLMYKFSDLV